MKPTNTNEQCPFVIFMNSFWIFQIKVVPSHPTTSHETGGDSESGGLLGIL